MVICKNLFLLFTIPVFLAPLCAEEPSAQIVRAGKFSPSELSALREQAVSGDAGAQLVLGLAYYGANRAFRKNQAEARYWLEMAARQGNPAARLWLNGISNQQGRNTSLTGGTSSAAPLLWWKEAAEAGSAEAAYNVGIMYLSGEGVPADELEAVYWLRRAANAGNVAAASRLGSVALARKGRLKPGPESTQWLRTAAEAGDGVSMLDLGMVLAHGWGASIDLPEAYMWFTLAVQRGLMDGRAGVCPKMTAAEVSMGENRAAVWNATHRR